MTFDGRLLNEAPGGRTAPALSGHVITSLGIGELRLLLARLTEEARHAEVGMQT
jgi:hypothetical protein